MRESPRPLAARTRRGLRSVHGRRGRIDDEGEIVFAAVLLMIVSGVLMVAIVAFLLIVNTRIERQQRERYFGDISHVRIPDNARELSKPAKRPKPPYRPF